MNDIVDSHMPDAVPVLVALDEIQDGFGMVRTAASPSVVVAVLHDGTPAALATAADYAGLLRAAPLMLKLLASARAAWSEQFDGDPDVDLHVPGADLVDWFTEWREDVRQDLRCHVPAKWL